MQSCLLKTPAKLAKSQSDLNNNQTCQQAYKSAGAKQLVFGVGNYQADLMLIGEAPGSKEDQTGEPFVGRAGQVLNKALDLIGLNRQDIFITNLVKWRPKNNSDPSPSDQAICQDLLKVELETIRPKLVVGLGRHASSFFKKDLNLARDNGQKIKASLGKVKFNFMPCYHPAACLYQPQLMEKFQQTFKNISKHVRQ